MYEYDFHLHDDICRVRRSLLKVKFLFMPPSFGALIAITCNSFPRSLKLSLLSFITSKISNLSICSVQKIMLYFFSININIEALKKDSIVFI